MKLRLFITLCLLLASFFLPSQRLAAAPPEAGTESQPPYTPHDLPAISFKDQNGRPIVIERFEGEVVLLHFWATWCGPCVRELPMIDALQEKYAKQGLKVVAVSEDDGMAPVRQFFQKKDIKHLELYMDDNGFSFSNLGLAGLPQTIIIDHNNKEAARIMGAINWNDPNVTMVIEDLLARRKRNVPGGAPESAAN